MADTLKNKVSPHIQSQLPEFVQADHPLFSLFLKYYYEFLESGELIVSGTNTYVIEETLSKNYILDENEDRVVLEDSVGKFTAGETIIGQTSKHTAKILVDDFDNNNRLFISSQQKFITGETIIGQTSGAVSTVVSYRANPVQSIQQLLQYADVDKTVYDFLDKFKDSFMDALPNTYAEGLEKRKLIKNIKDLYAAKGTEDGHKLFFRILFGEEATISYPRDNILRTSDGLWSTDKIMRVLETGTSDFNRAVGQRITGQTSGATALIATVIKFREGSVLIAELNLDADSVSGEFISGETVTTIDTELDLEISAIVESIVTGGSVDIGGAYYNVNDPVYITGDTGNGAAAARVEGIGAGSIDEVMIADGGSGYSIGEELSFDTTNTEGTDVRARIAVVGGGFVLESFTDPDHFITEDGESIVTDDDIKYISQEQTVGEEPYLLMEDGGQIILEEETFNDLGVSSEIGEITKIEMINRGNGFTKLPTVTTSSSTSGSGASLFAASTVSPMVGAVQGVVITNFGLEYTTAPTFTLNRNILVKNVSGTFTAGDELTSHNAVVVNFDSATNILQLRTSVTFNRDDPITSITGATATVYQNDFAKSTSSVGTVGETVGNFVNDRGKLSNESMKLQDSFYYQDYSYVVRVGESINQWRESIRRSVHPAGWNVFGEVSFASQVSASIQIPSAGSVSGFDGDTTTFSPELASTFTNLFTTVFGRRLGTTSDSVPSLSPKVGKNSWSDLTTGQRDVTLTSHVKVGINVNRGSHWTGYMSLATLPRYAFAVHPVYTAEIASNYHDPHGRRTTTGNNITRDQWTIAQWGHVNIADVSDYFFLRNEEGLDGDGDYLLLEDGGRLQGEELHIPEEAFRTRTNVPPSSYITIDRGGLYNTFDSDFITFDDEVQKFDEEEFGRGEFDSAIRTFDGATTFDTSDLLFDTEGRYSTSFDETSTQTFDSSSFTFDHASGDEEDYPKTWDRVNTTSATLDSNETTFDTAPDGTVTKQLFSSSDGMTWDADWTQIHMDESESNVTPATFGNLDQKFDFTTQSFDKGT